MMWAAAIGAVLLPVAGIAAAFSYGVSLLFDAGEWGG